MHVVLDIVVQDIVHKTQTYIHIHISLLNHTSYKAYNLPTTSPQPPHHVYIVCVYIVCVYNHVYPLPRPPQAPTPSPTTPLLRVKWPNDLYSHTGLKVGGILCHTAYKQGRFSATIGVGLNVTNRQPTTCVEELVRGQLGREDVCVSREVCIFVVGGGGVCFCDDDDEEEDVCVCVIVVYGICVCVVCIIHDAQ